MKGDEKTGRAESEAMEFSVEELREFLEGDLLSVRADPEFKDRLRRKLWELVQARNLRNPAKG